MNQSDRHGLKFNRTKCKFMYGRTSKTSLYCLGTYHLEMVEDKHRKLS